MPEIIEQLDLCSACAHEPGCIYPKDQNRPVRQCEEFELCFFTPPPARETARPASAGRRDETDSGTYAGLCSNCEHRKTCIYPRPEGGVWHCEEYE